MNILIVSDNPVLVSFVKNEIKELAGLENCVVEYRHSPENSNQDEMRALGSSSMDIKAEKEIEYIIKKIDLVLSLHCKQIFPPQVVNVVRCINVHPGFNPYNRGWFPQVFSVINKKKFGATIHIMDECIDHGGIIAQKEIVVTESDSSLSLYEKVIMAEKELLGEYLLKIIAGEYTTKEPIFEGNYNSFSDFLSVCELDMDSIGTLRQHVDMLRALSHGDFKNAYFYDQNGKKIYLALKLDDSEKECG